MENSAANKVILLQLAVFAINTNVNMHGLIPMFLVYGMLSRLPGIDGTGCLPQDQRMRLLHAAREKSTIFIVRRRIALGLKKNVPSAADAIYEGGDMAYLWHEDAKLWTGPWKIDTVESKKL